MAWSFLKSLGFRLIARNFSIRYGEIDLICLDGDTVVFVEVKTRTNLSFGPGFEAVGREKKKKMIRTAKWFLAQRGWEERPARFDVVSIDLNQGLSGVEHLADAFDVPA